MTDEQLYLKIREAQPDKDWGDCVGCILSSEHPKINITLADVMIALGKNTKGLIRIDTGGEMYDIRDAGYGFVTWDFKKTLREQSEAVKKWLEEVLEKI